ncbi:hypothetical protein [Pontibacter ruber]|uniref:TIGR04255 family protein n=1 Tax=Pontibacter ruber TaxID=1343895 RepID=A0ABW5CW81_9BACT|nr:hypothetical protein [Pontibacter ruber]
MNREEEIVYQFLLDKNYEDVQHEPNCLGNNCNIPPDFSIKGNIGIEVRRLNQHHFTESKIEPLEQLDYNLIPKIDSLLKSYNNSQFEKSSFVTINFKRPIKADKNFIKKLKQALDEHLKSLSTSKILHFGNLTLKLHPASTSLGSAYHLGAIVDSDSGGGVVSNIYRNLEIVLEEKQNKVRSHHNRYDSWWLILVDYISYGLSTHDLEQLNALPQFEHCFDKVLLLSPLDVTHVSEVNL